MLAKLLNGKCGQFSLGRLIAVEKVPWYVITAKGL